MAKFSPMTGRWILFSVLSVLFSGCIPLKKDNGRKKGPFKPLHVQRQERAGKHGYKFFPGVGWKYFPIGRDPKILTLSPLQLMEHAHKSLKEEDLDEGMREEEEDFEESRQ